MDIEATCGCGAKVKIHPDNGGYQQSSYGIEAKTREEREACSAAFKEWVQAHTICARPMREPDPMPFNLDIRRTFPEQEPSPYRDGASGD